MKKIFFIVLLLCLIIPLYQSVAFASVSTQKYNRKVYLLIFNPDVDSTESVINKYGWNDPDSLSNQVVEFFQDNSYGKLNFSIVKKQIIKDFTYLEDGFKYTSQSFHECLIDSSKCHVPQMADYKKIIVDYDICNLVNSKQIDELWMWGGPYFGFYESRLVGKNGYWYNGSPLNVSECNRLVPVMGFNYERGLSEVVEDFGHRTEATFSFIYDGWQMDEPVTLWDNFTSNKGNSGSQTIYGCGNVHFPSNGVSDYDWGNKTSVNSYCDGFKDGVTNYEKNVKKVNCDVWGCSSLGYFAYWYKSIPRFTNSIDGVSNDWWKYIADPNVALTPILECKPNCNDKNCGDLDGCGGKCNGSCSDIPKDVCKDEDTLLDYNDAKCTIDYKCNYLYAEVNCEYGCNNGKCNTTELNNDSTQVDGNQDINIDNLEQNIIDTGIEKSESKVKTITLVVYGIVGLLVSIATVYICWRILKKRKKIISPPLVAENTEEEVSKVEIK